jgi:hypothetical protein
MADKNSFSKRALAAALAGIVALTIAILPQGIWPFSPDPLRWSR